MRKIIDKGKGEQIQKRNSIIIGLALVVLMLFSIVGYGFLSSEKTNDFVDKITYKEIDFKQDQSGRWNFNIQGIIFNTEYNPLETQDIATFVNLDKVIGDYQNKVLYFGINDIEDVNQIGNTEIAINLEQLLERIGLACLSEECKEDYPIKACNESNIIIFENKEDNFIEVREDEQGCVHIVASNENTEKASDAFLFKILGIN